MGMGQQSIQTVTQTANTGAQLSIQAATILGLIMTKHDSDLVQDWMEKGFRPDSDFIVPTEKLFEFRMMCAANGIEFAEMLDPEHPEPEFTQIVTKGPRVNDLELDEFGNIVGVAPGGEGDRKSIEQFVSIVTNEYKAEHNLEEDREDELGNEDAVDNILKDGEAQRAWKNSKTVMVTDLSRPEMEMLTNHADTLGIDTFVRYDFIADKYAVEMAQSSMERSPLAPDVPSKGERLIQDYLITSSHPGIDKILKEQEISNNKISERIKPYIDKDLVPSDNSDIVLTEIDKLKVGESPDLSIILHPNHTAEIVETVSDFKGRDGWKSASRASYDLGTKEGLEIFYEKYKQIQNVGYLDEIDFDSIVNADITNDVDLSSADDTLARIKSAHKEEHARDLEFARLKSSIYHQCDILAAEKTVELTINKTEQDKGFQTVEQRVPNSDVIITDTILAATRDNNQEMQEKMKENLDEKLNHMHITNASMFESIPSYMLKDQNEILLDDKKLSHDAAISQGLTAEEASIFTNASEVFQDIRGDDTTPMVNSHTSVIVVETQETSDGETRLKITPEDKEPSVDIDEKKSIYLDKDGNDITDEIVAREISSTVDFDYDAELDAEPDDYERYRNDPMFSDISDHLEDYDVEELEYMRTHPEEINKHDFDDIDIYEE